MGSGVIVHSMSVIQPIDRLTVKGGAVVARGSCWLLRTSWATDLVDIQYSTRIVIYLKILDTGPILYDDIAIKKPRNISHNVGFTWSCLSLSRFLCII